MDIKEKEALVTEIERFKEEALKMHTVQVLADTYKHSSLFDYSLDSDGSVIWYKAQARQLWDFWQAKSQAVPEPALDAPACVGAGTFQKGVKWSTVIGAAQRHYENDGHHERPAVSVADQLRIASGHSVVVPKDSLKVALYWMDEDIDPWQMGGDSFAELYKHKPILEALVEAQEQKG